MYIPGSYSLLGELLFIWSFDIIMMPRASHCLLADRGNRFIVHFIAGNLKASLQLGPQ